MIKKLNTDSGFTLIELIITISITAILASVGFVNLIGYFQRKNLDLTGQEVAAVLRSAQSYSTSQEDGKQWGIHFENTTSSDEVDFYELFSGASYSTSTVAQKVPLQSGINFSNPPIGQSINVFFAPTTGLSTSTVISIIGSVGGVVKDVIIKNNGGVVDNLEEELVGYWHFDEGTGHATTTDASGYGNTGTLTNEPTWASGSSCKSGECISFDGENDYVDISTSADFTFGTGDFAITTWIKTDAAPTACWRAVVSIGDGHTTDDAITIYAPGTGSVPTGSVSVILNRVNPTMNSDTLVDDGNWHHITVIRNSTGAYLYIDGKEEDTAGTSIDVTSSMPVYIGTTPNCGTFFSGVIDEVRIYNRALSATEVLRLYNDFK